MSRITSGNAKKKAGKCFYNCADLEVALPVIQGGVVRKVAARVKYSKVHNRFHSLLDCKIFYGTSTST